MTAAQFKLWRLDAGRAPLVMGVLNVTPDSFSDGGRFTEVGEAVAHARRMVEAGAALIDIGGESTRPGAARIGATVQIERVLPVIEAIRAQHLECVLSIDTTRAAVARAAVEAGATLINDISAGIDDPEMLPLAARMGVPIVLMHMQGQPATMQEKPTYQDVVAEVEAALRGRARAALEAGIPPADVLLDPGIGFGKAMAHNLSLLRAVSRFAAMGYPLLLGTSRKGFLGRISGESERSGRVMATAASVAWCVANGASMVRVHDVEAMMGVVKVVAAIRNGLGE